MESKDIINPSLNDYSSFIDMLVYRIVNMTFRSRLPVNVISMTGSFTRWRDLDSLTENQEGRALVVGTWYRWRGRLPGYVAGSFTETQDIVSSLLGNEHATPGHVVLEDLGKQGQSLPFRGTLRRSIPHVPPIYTYCKKSKVTGTDIDFGYLSHFLKSCQNLHGLRRDSTLLAIF